MSFIESNSAKSRASLPATPGFVVLVVEDNPVNQQILAHYLRSFGVDFEIVANGLEAVNAVQARPFGLVLMDIQMPVMDGVAATEAIRRLAGPERFVPIFAVTAYSSPDQDKTYLKAGMNGVIAKPVPAAHLHRTLTETCAAVKVQP